MHVEVEGGRVAVAPSGRFLAALVCASFAALAFAAWALESSILLPAGVIARYDALRAGLDAWASAHLPASALPVATTLATLLLSPLLYAGLAAVLLAERLAPADRDQPLFSRGMIQDGVGWFLIDAPLKALFYVGSLGLLYWALDAYAPFLRVDPRLTARAPTWALVLAAVVAGDLLKWFHHYLNHKLRFLWHFHSVHHSQRELNMFTQARFHAVEAISLIPMLYVPLYALNLDFELAVWILLFIDWFSRVSHANLRTTFGPLKYVLVTPQSHRIHHSCEGRHRDRNFATLFCVWDRLFGTQWHDDKEYPPTGIADEEFPWEKSVGGTHVLSNYVAQLIYPFRQFRRDRTRAVGASSAENKSTLGQADADADLAAIP